MLRAKERFYDPPPQPEVLNVLLNYTEKNTYKYSTQMGVIYAVKICSLQDF